MILKKVLSVIISTFCLLIFGQSWSQVNVPPNIQATGDQNYCPLSQINVVSTFDIIDPDDTEIEALYIQISTGYVNGEDSLVLTGIHPNVVSSWDNLEGKLSLSGVGGVNVSYTDLITAVYDVVYQSSSASVSGDKFFSFTVGDANYLPSTGHYYEYVPDVGITWTAAKTDAAARTYFGLQGYLATITSAEEAQLSGEQAAGAGWIGGSDANSEGVWQWETGPEAGTVFWNGGINGTTPNYANWNTNEPNDCCSGINGEENYAHVTAPNIGTPGSWNDLPNTGDASPSSPYHPQGYVVEYGDLIPGDLDNLNISASTKITTPSITNTFNAEICGQGSMTLEATASNGMVVWFDALTGGNQVHTGTIFTTPVLTVNTSYYVLASVNGCLEGERTQVTATVKPIPTITSVTDELVCNQGSATLIATSSAGVINWYNVSTGGIAIATGTSFTTPVLTATTIYYVDATEFGCTTTTRTPVTLTVQHTPAPTGNSPQTFCDIDNATVGDLRVTGTDILWYATNTDTTLLSSTDLLTNGTYYATQTENTCESTSRLAIDVTIFETIVPLAAIDIPVLETCDDDLDGDYTNGVTEFDLTSQESILLNGMSSADFNFTYFTDIGYSNLIANPLTFQNTISGGQTIYVRMSNNADSGCFTDTSFNIQVNPLPNVLASKVFKNCDEDGTPDGFTDFNLNEVNSIITSEDMTVVNITFYLSPLDAEQDVNQVNASPFNNQTANTVYARVEFANTGCYRVSTINLEVSTTSFPLGYIHELEICDTDAIIDGIAEFDLTSASTVFISVFPTGQNLSVHYFHNLSDAQLEQNEITNVSNYENQTPFSETLFVRVESDDNGECFGIGPHLLLTVHPRPEFQVDQDNIFCLNGSPITLSTYNPNGNLTYEWMDENGAVIGNSPTVQVNEGGEYSVIATSVFNCESFPETFKVVESGISDITIEDVTVVDLSDNNTITIDTTDIGIGDYEFSLDNEFGPFQDNPFFDHVHSGDRLLFVRDKNGCGTKELPVFVLGFPKFFTPNGDTYNDTWNIRGLGNDYTSNSTIRIYDRYGKLIKQLIPGVSGWNGTFNGETLSGDDYWFVANLVDTSGNLKIYKGHFSLVR
ncbi:T9SS type B sorting domain-containing protein [Seonamhaeicola maritimus]|uniref:T9SS type B sorting domain-containing protein n=1 Tax=Seonamhaeicola maritimus TaxID=2591822 RepID=A0A5C7GLJ8_9FLAO|nr:T9SS type B sorting domain-containing protein [Seonamhaeicola maritimus]